MTKTLMRLVYLHAQCLRHHHAAWAAAIEQRINLRRHA
jgi:hypothetical protein